MGLNGESFDVDCTGTRDRLVVFFSSEYEACQLSLPVYRLLSEMCGLSLTLAFTDISGPAMTTWWNAKGDGFSADCNSISVGSVLTPPSLYRLRGTPTHYLIGTDGRVKHHAEGMLSEVPAWLDP